MINLTSEHGIELIKIKPGSFLMGSDFDALATLMQRIMMNNQSWESWSSLEWPQHPVKISQGFHISKYPVTNRIYRTIMSDDTTTGSEEKPVLLNWQQVESFLQRLNTQGDQFCFRLPTEAEWEYCCKSGTGYEFLKSDDHDNNEKYIVTGDDLKELDDVYKTIGSSGKNRWGICDMLGNVPEWCSDYFDPDYYLNSPTTDPENTTISEIKVMRGAPYFYGTGAYPIPYRSSARYPINITTENPEDETQTCDCEEEYDCPGAGLRLIATSK